MNLPIGEYLIRDLVLADVPSVARHADNPKIARNLRDLFPCPYGEQDALEFILKSRSTDPRTAFAIASPEEAIGIIGFVPGSDVYRFSAEIGYWLGEPYWGRGIMTAAVRAFADHLFANFAFNRLFAGTFSSNPASGRVLAKAGFTREAILRAHVTKAGEILDEHVYAKLRPDLEQE